MISPQKQIEFWHTSTLVLACALVLVLLAWAIREVKRMPGKERKKLLGGLSVAVGGFLMLLLGICLSKMNSF